MFLALFVTSLVFGAALSQTCNDPNQVYIENVLVGFPPCGKTYLCKDLLVDYSERCANSFFPRQSICVCKEDGYLLSEDGACILIANCPPEPNCGAGATYYKGCAPCEKTCPGVYNPDLCVNYCRVGRCACLPGYLRNEKNVCVLPQDCNTVALCGEGEVFYSSEDCMYCEKTCENWYRETCDSDICISKTCICKPGYMRKGPGICVPISECPAPVCGTGEKFYPEDVECVPCEACNAEDCTSECRSNVCGCEAGLKRIDSTTCAESC